MAKQVMYWDLELSHRDCPVITLSLFGQEIELAILRCRKWGPDVNEGVGADLEIMEMAWGAPETYCWRPVHPLAVVQIERAYKLQLMEGMELWERNRML